MGGREMRMHEVRGHTPDCRCANCTYEANNPRRLIDATKFYGMPIPAADLISAHVEVAVGRLFREDRQLAHILTHSVELADRPKNAADRRGHGIARVLYTWLRREREDQEAMAKDIESLASLGRTDRWKGAVRTWAHIARTDPDMFQQQATYANYATD
jgi:hypothetical protein